jgi:hypothetical protein
MTRTTIITATALVLAVALPAAPALAQRDRVFVASYGSDSNPCTFGSPCKTFQQAVNVVAQGGEVTAIDSAGFGTVIIQHSVTITSPNGVEAGIAAPASGGAAITINAQLGDIITLNGLTLDGANVAAANGIAFNTGGNLNVRDSVIRNFGSGAAIQFLPTGSNQTELSVSDTLVSDSSFGISFSPAGSGPMVATLDHVEMRNNVSDGLFVGAGTKPVKVTVSNSVIASNDTGIDVQSSNAPAVVMVRNSTVANNTTYGLEGDGSAAVIRVTRSTITGNGTGWLAAVGAVVTTYADNNVIDNATEGTPSSSIGYQ